MSNPTNDEIKNRNLLIRSIIFIFFVSFLIYLFFVFLNLRMDALLAFLILLFFLLVMIGPIFYGFKGSFYSRLFQKKKKKEWTEKKPNYSKSKMPIPYTTEIKFRKPLIRNCPSCGMTVASFVKKCPQCGTIIMS